MEQRKTGEEWLKNLPLQKRLQFKEQTRRNFKGLGCFKVYLDRTTADLADTLNGAFVWNMSKQGHEYWSNINKKYGVDGN